MDDNYITMTDEDGNEFIMEHLDTLEYLDEAYMAFGLVEPDAELPEGGQEEVAVVIMKVVEQNGEELLEEVADEKLCDKIFKLFEERNSEEE
ncbi:MAG: DUF1292 domain-containing protein [Oscillospiraceae bacterium]|nr:DUF1292 domain-containing protein [Oscillospiraceae bacterium]